MSHAKSSKSCVYFTAFAVFRSCMELVAIDYTAQLSQIITSFYST